MHKTRQNERNQSAERPAALAAATARELQQESQAGAANTGNMLLLSLEQELNISRRQKGEAKREKKVEKRR